MTITNFIGYLAALLSTASFVPQARKIIQARKTNGISSGMYLLTVTGFAMWIAFGLRTGQWPRVASNCICLLLSAFILVMKLFPPKTKELIAEAIAPE
jgi:MtN3 and saliva related transmembrane protein